MMSPGVWAGLRSDAASSFPKIRHRAILASQPFVRPSDEDKPWPTSARALN